MTAQALLKLAESKTPFAVFVVAPQPGGKLAVTTRPTDKGGGYGLPGGKVDSGEDPLAAALRESREEGWEIESIDPEPIHRAEVDGNLVHWYTASGKSKPLEEYKEKHRGVKPLSLKYEDAAATGFGNEFLKTWRPKGAKNNA